MKPFVLVAGDFMPTGGMDRANHAFASYLARKGHPIHLVGHRVASDLVAWPVVSSHVIAKPFNSYLLGSFRINSQGRRWATRIAHEGGRVLVNGGNCTWGDVNWVHYVHAAYPPSEGESGTSLYRRMRHRLYAWQERTALKRARVVVVNSERTRSDVIGRVGIASDRIRVVYLGTDPTQFRPHLATERDAARVALTLPMKAPVVTFVGALSDRRKGFDTVFEAWKTLCAESSWSGHLLVVATGSEVPIWRQRTEQAGLGGRVRFLGFQSDIPRVLAASDLLVAPTRYEPYGLGVHEALCCGLPALVSAAAGVAERYPSDLAELLMTDPDNAGDLVGRLRRWQENPQLIRERVRPFSEQLRSWTWDDMSRQILTVIGEPDA